MLFADRGYDHDKYSRLLRQRGIRPAIAERGQPHDTGLGTFRWVVERTISWLHGFRRLRIRRERRDDIHPDRISPQHPTHTGEMPCSQPSATAFRRDRPLPRALPSRRRTPRGYVTVQSVGRPARCSRGGHRR
ncbi:transposase [Streptomyces chartreusis]